MNNPNQLSQPEPDQPNQVDQPYNQVDFFTRWLAEGYAAGALDPSKPIPAPGDISMLPPALQEMILKSRQEQADNSTPPPDTPAPPEAPQ